VVGWLIDRYGVCWQIMPTVFEELMRDSDPARSKRGTVAMLKMIKFDIAALLRAASEQ
jgi:predicted 3-demethylubiquinone-9 3-methyltransferase (glyoxalase superfamily)